MTQDVQRRSEFVLFVALSLGLGAGLWVLPAFDPLDALSRWPAPAALIAGLLHGVLAWMGGELALACLVRRQLAGRQPAALRWAWRVLVAGALAWWAASPWWQAVHDARALLWLQLMPLLLWPSGLLGWRDLRSAARAEPMQQVRHDQRVQDQVHVRRGGQMPVAGVRQASRAGRKDDVVAMAVEASEQSAA
jgi:hypothetical protein